MIRRTPLKRSSKPIQRKTPLKRSSSGIARSTKPIPKRSDKEKKRLAKYFPIAKKFKEDNPECQLMITEQCTGVTTEVHHAKGRIGDLLFNIKFFKAACHFCHDYAELHPEEAKEKGVSQNRLTID